MSTRGRFVCHVHCLVHDGAVHSSPCGPHHKNFRWNLYHMFVPAYSASQILCFDLWYSSCFEVKCGFHTFSKWCSHISMWMIILLDYRDCHVNSFPTGALLFEMIPSFSPSAISFPSFLNGVCFVHPKLPLFSRPPTLFLQGPRFLNQVSILFM